MAKPNEEKTDGLEIISIGKLYNGPWDKKYWSSSRGKDRYPYPVGYQAVRTRNAITYKTEILEGLKGPLFMISSTDGMSCSGQTPDIAWESFQKKGCPGIKLWHGKRFSCKIDGVEFFGFKNALVQRLLRELVSNVSGTAERSLSSSSICNGASITQNPTPHKESCQYPDLLPDLAKPQVTGRRSRKYKIINVKSISEASVKRLRPPDQAHNGDATNFRQENQRNHNDENSSTSSASKKKHGFCNKPGLVQDSVILETIVKEKNNPYSVDGTHLNSFDFPDHLKEEALIQQEENKLISSNNYLAAEKSDNLSKNEKPLDRSKVTEKKRCCSPKPVEEKDGATSIPNDSQTINDVDLCAPDTFDPLDDTSNSPHNSPKEIPRNVPDELITTEIVVSEVMETESHPEGETGLCTSNTSSEKSDFDSVDQEIAKSMMTVLLPRALPLIKTFSRKKKSVRHPSDISLHRNRSQQKNNGADLCEDVTTPARVLAENCNAESQKEKLHTLSTHIGSVIPSGQITSFVPDSFENDQCGHHLNQLPLFSDMAEADQTTFGQDIDRAEIMRLPSSGHVPVESLICHFETSDGKTNLCDEVHMASNEGLQMGTVLLSKTFLCQISATKRDVCMNSDQKPICVETHSEKKDIKSLPGCTEATIVTTEANSMHLESSTQMPPKEINVEPGVASTGNRSFAQITDITSSCNILSESIIVRKSGDVYAKETCTARKTSLPSDIYLVSYSGHSPVKKVSLADEATLDGQSHSLCTEKNPINWEGANAMDVEGPFRNMDFVTPSQHQETVWVANYDDTSKLLNPSILGVDESQASVDKELLKQSDLVNLSCLQKQGTSFCGNILKDKELKEGSYLNAQGNMNFESGLGGILELVGCYMHPMPIISVLLRTEGNEIYLCVICGHLVREDRFLFIYKAPTEGKRIGYPSFIGHAPLMFPVLKDEFGREIALDCSGLQFSPDGQCLVLLNRIKAPYCREGKIHCPCSTCTSDHFEMNAVNIVQVKLGYVSVVANLKTAEKVRCILVCDPSYLVAAEESGRLNLWVMNSRWSAHTEECYLPTSDCMPPCIVDLKRIPKHAALIIGHNGFGEFSLWNVSKRILLSRFSAPGTSVFGFLPVGLFRWPSTSLLRTGLDTEKHISEIMDATKIWFSDGGDNYTLFPLEGEDVAIWLLISTVSDTDDQHSDKSSEYHINQTGCWRLALLMKKTLIFGSSLDPRAAAIGASSGHGIIGTSDGLAYMWELSTGTKLGNLHCFKGGVSCIATDSSSSGALAVAGDGGQLLVYLHSQRAFEDQQGIK